MDGEHLEPFAREALSRTAEQRIDFLRQPRWVGYQRARGQTVAFVFAGTAARTWVIADGGRFPAITSTDCSISSIGWPPSWPGLAFEIFLSARTA
jgi:hypothetical protein